MEGKTYLELLAENDEEARREFQPNAKDLLTANFVEYDDNVEGHDPHPDELHDQADFQKPAGSHQLASLLPEPEKDVHKTTSNVRYDKDVQVHVISIDSRFRTNQLDNPSNFLFKLLTPIKNAISVRLSSLEIPNTWYTFSNIRGNISMIINIYGSTEPDLPELAISKAATANVTTGRVVITEGNYSVFTDSTNDILVELYRQLQQTFPTYAFSVIFNAITGKITISCFTLSAGNTYTYTNQPTIGSENPIYFSINFADSIFSNRDDNWGLGYNLGYRIKQTDPATSVTGEAIVDVLDSNYVFLSLNPDWKVVEHNQPDRSQTSAFAKVIVNVGKNDIVYDTGQNTITKRYFLRQPTNITSFNISIVDENEQYVMLQGGNVSMTLEVTEVLHASLYEAMRV
jgi:hypothetical protein